MVDWAVSLESGRDGMSRKGRKEPPLKSDLAGQKVNRAPAGRLPQVIGSPWFAAVVLVAAVLASYANSLRGPFVFDDHSDIIDNPTIRHLWPLEDVFLDRSEVRGGCNPGPW